MTPLFKVGLLSTANDPTLGVQLANLVEAGISVDVIVLDDKRFSEKDLGIFQQRTAGRIQPIALESFGDALPPVLTVPNHNDPLAIDLITARGLDLLVNAGTPRILKPGILRATRLGVLNCHPGILPMFRGCTCVEWALLLDGPVGNTVHWMSAGIDEGPVLARQQIDIAVDDTYVDVRTRVYRSGYWLLARVINDLAAGRLDPSGEIQGEGRYFEPMSETQLDVVKQRLADGLYQNVTNTSGVDPRA